MDSIGSIISTLGVLLMVSAPIMIVVLGVNFVAAHKRIASSQEELIKVQTEISKQLASLSIELKHNSKNIQ